MNKQSKMAAVLLGIFLTALVAAAAVLTCLKEVLPWRIALVLGLSAAVCVWLAILYFQQKRVNIILRQSERAAQQQNEVLTEYYEPLDAKLYEIEKFRHDLKNYISLLDIETKKQEDLQAEEKQTAEELIAKTEALLPERLCENKLVNRLVYLKKREAEAQGITFRCALLIPDTVALASTDLCSVFFNLLDNAIYANSRFPAETSRWISIKADIVGVNLVIKQQNTYFDIPESAPTEDLLVSRKNRDRQGYGVHILQDIAAKYDGSAVFDAANGVFSSCLYLKIS